MPHEPPTDAEPSRGADHDEPATGATTGAREPRLARLGRLVARRRRTILVVSGLLFLASLAGLIWGGTLTTVLSSSSESGRAVSLMERELTSPLGQSFAIIFSSKTLTVRDPNFRAAVEEALRPVEAHPRVQGVRTPYNASSVVADTLVSRDAHHALVQVSLGDDPRIATEAFKELKPRLRSPELRVMTTGELAINHDFDTILVEDLRKVELIALPLALLVLLLVFRTLVASLLPLGVAGLAVTGGMAGVFTLARVANVSQYAINIVSMIGLGVAIDYSLFIVSRFREELKSGLSVEDAVARTMATAGRAVLFSGVAVAVGLIGFLFFRGVSLDTMGMAGAIVVGLAVFYSLTFLPALLAALGHRVDRGALPFTRRLSTAGLWHRLARWVMRYPVGILAPTLGLLLVAGSPFGDIELATSDVYTLPPRAESRQAHDLLRREFPTYDPQQIVVVVTFPDAPLAQERLAPLTKLARRLGALPRVTGVQSIVSPDPRLTRGEQELILGLPRLMMPEMLREAIDETVGEHIIVLTVTVSPDAPRAHRSELVRQIRAHRQVGDGELLVTGLPAIDLDQADYIRDRAPMAVGVVMTLTYVVLFLLLGSVILPLKAVVMNLMSLTASFGALVWIFQQGHLSNLLGFIPGPIEPALPIVLFCLVFGLSMDYEVFLLSRIQEEHLRSGDNVEAVAEGLERSGRLITSAAAIMIVVFAAFAFADVVPVKAVGLGMALAVALDATVVRVLLVPATMRLFGNLNWWSPGPLRRLYRRVGLGELCHSAERPRPSGSPEPG